MITFLSDFGLEDAYVAQVKARILSARPDAVIVDITHQAFPYDIRSAAWLLHTSWPYFPSGTIHLCVVDPGVGTQRPVLAIRKEGRFFIGPDNGVFSFIYPGQTVTEVTWRPETSIAATFHGRDVFAPVVVEILKGKVPEDLGHPFDKPVSFDISHDMVVHIDRFGTLVTNIDERKLKQGCAVIVGGRRIDRIAKTFADIPSGEAALIRGSASTVEIAANRSRAADILQAKTGMEVVFEPAP